VEFCMQSGHGVSHAREVHAEYRVRAFSYVEDTLGCAGKSSSKSRH
jgi:hypothetical protein